MISFIGNGVPTLVRRCLDTVVAKDVDYDAALTAFRKHYLAAPTALSRPYEGVMEMLDGLTNEGFKLAVCTIERDNYRGSKRCATCPGRYW